MGYAARANGCAFEGKASPRGVLESRLRRIVEACPTYEAFEQLAERAGLTERERVAIEAFLPASLQPKGSV